MTYIYVSSTSEAVRAHAATLAQALVARCRLAQNDLVVEVASNDGTVLKAFQEQQLRVLGVEPAKNISELAVAAGIPTVTEFFTEDVARRVAEDHGRVSVILARHVFAHVDGVHDFLRAVNRLLADDGVFVVEVPYLGDLIENLEFDTIYHEHLSYFGLAPLIRLCRQHSLRIVDVERVSLHGGSILLYIRRASSALQESADLRLMVEAERAGRFCSEERLVHFAQDVAAWKQQFESLVHDLVLAGAVIVGYGAAAKANTLLNYCPDVARELACIIDRSPHKHGRFTPGTHRPVVAVGDRCHKGATHMVILAWNLKEEILRQMKPFAESGGRFIVPLPVPAVL